MTSFRYLDFAFPFVVSLLLPACGGSIEPSPPVPGSTPAATSPARGEIPSEVSSGDSTTHPANPAATACHVHPRQSVTGLDSCVVARQSMTLEVMGIAWADPALAWRQGGHAWLEIRYQNASDADPIEYPGAVVTSSDPRAQTDSEAHGDPVVHPDLYALSPCMVYDSRDHSFTLRSGVPTGTKLTFTVSAAVADGNGISSCSDTLPTTVASFVAP